MRKRFHLEVWIVVVAAAVIAGISTAPGAMGYQGVEWGNEVEHEGRSLALRRPFLTPDPERVEVVLLFWYASRHFKKQLGHERKWVESLPDGVDVIRMPFNAITAAQARTMSSLWRSHHERHQQALFVARLAGREAPVHEQLVARMAKNSKAFETDSMVHEVLLEEGVPDGLVKRFFRGPEVGGLKYLAGAYVNAVIMGGIRAGLLNWGNVQFPVMLINGRYGVTAETAGGVAKAYRVANRLIRLEFERGRAHTGPTDNESFSRWISPRAGEILWRQSRRVVFSHWRNEWWELGEEGEVRGIARLKGEGKDSYYRLSLGDHLVDVPMWRGAYQFESFDGRPRYGAFLLTDWLSSADTHWVGLPWKGREGAFAFSADGTVEARNATGPIFGSWWLEAGKLHVSLGELGIESWPWMEVASRVGFEVPQESLTPWNR